MVKATFLGLILSLFMGAATFSARANGPACARQFRPFVEEDVEWGRAAGGRHFYIRKPIPGTNDDLYGDASYYPDDQSVAFFIVAKKLVNGTIYVDPEFTGSFIITALVQHIRAQGLPIRALIGNWSTQDRSMGDNLESFNDRALQIYDNGIGLLDGGYLTQGQLQTAAWATFTGKMARRLGFTRISQVGVDDETPGNYTRVVVEFVRP